MLKLWLLHPAAAHFPLALLPLGFVAAGILHARGKPQWLDQAFVCHEHETLAYWTAGSFTLLGLWRRFLPRLLPRLFLALWLAALGALFSTGFHGGELVFDHGMGRTPPDAP